MGPNVLWLAESLLDSMSIEGMQRVLDMGCGKAVSSIFFAQEFDVQVWATDLWIKPDENFERVREAGIEDRVFPVFAEAHTLPFAKSFFDALVSLDAYHYFGTDDLYLGYFSSFVKPGGQIGIVVPGVLYEFSGGVPTHLVPYWERDFCSFHSPEWWRDQWEKTGLVKVEVADSVSDGWKLWLRWLEVAAEFGFGGSEREAEMLRIDSGRTLGFTRVVARRY